MKQIQRDELTKEKQERLATGGGPETSIANIDPDVAEIAPHLMQTAPVLFSSNMTGAEVKERREMSLNMISANDNIIAEAILLDDTEYVDDPPSVFCKQSDLKESDSSAASSSNIALKKIILAEQTIKETEASTICQREIENPSDFYTLKSTRKRKKVEGISSNSINEESAKVERVTNMIKHEERMAIIKEQHLKEVNQLAIKHLKEIQQLEIRLYTAKAEIAETQLRDKEYS